MRSLLLTGYGTSLRVGGHALEIYWRSEGRKESCRPQQLPYDSVVIDSMTESVSFEGLRFLAVQDAPAPPLQWSGLAAG